MPVDAAATRIDFGGTTGDMDIYDWCENGGRVRMLQGINVKVFNNERGEALDERYGERAKYELIFGPLDSVMAVVDEKGLVVGYGIDMGALFLEVGKGVMKDVAKEWNQRGWRAELMILPYDDVSEERLLDGEVEVPNVRFIFERRRVTQDFWHEHEDMEMKTAQVAVDVKKNNGEKERFIVVVKMMEQGIYIHIQTAGWSGLYGMAKERDNINELRDKPTPAELNRLKENFFITGMWWDDAEKLLDEEVGK